MDYRQSLRSSKSTKAQYRLISWLSPLILIILWIVLTEGGIVKELYLPSPTSVLSAAGDIGWNLVGHTLSTLTRTMLGLGLGGILGFSWGILMAHSSLIYAISNNIVEAWRPVPPVALIPFFLLWFGFSNLGKIVLVTLGVGLVVLVDTYESARSIHPNLLRAAYCLGAKKSETLINILVPATLPKIIGGLRVAAAIGIGLEVVSEFMGAQNGLGYLINVSKVTFRTPTILLCTIILGIISWQIDYVIRAVMKRLTFWAEYRQDSSNSTENIIQS